jgi:NAD+ synthase
VVEVTGGVDAAVVVALAARALGRRSVLGVVLPYQSDRGSRAEGLFQAFGIRRLEHDISREVDPYFQGEPEASAVRRAEKMARERMSILYDLAARERGLVLGSRNKTELLLGHGTPHGDLACSLNPVGDLYRTQIRRLASHLGVPRSILRSRSPSRLAASPRLDRLDRVSPRRLDRLLHLLVDQRASREEALRHGFSGRIIESVLGRMRASHVNHSLPVIAKVSDRTVGLDFRYPRDWGM